MKWADEFLEKSAHYFFLYGNEKIYFFQKVVSIYCAENSKTIERT